MHRGDEDRPVDVLVIGAGPSGAIVTHTLATRGIDVMCLEQGDWVNPSDFPGNHSEWELLTQQQWHHDPNIRKGGADYPLNVSDCDMTPVMFNAVGGSTIFFGAQWPRLLPSDFSTMTLDGVGDDWPFGYEDLKPFHDEVDEFVGVSGIEGDPAYPLGLAYPMPPHPIGRLGQRAAEAMNRLGWHWWPGTNAIVGYKHKTLEPCVRWGTCETGCPAGAKASFDLIYMPQALQAGARLQTGARVREITTDSRGRASGATWIDRHGQEHHQTAKAVVMCANGIGTARLLLMSASSQHPDGLANSSGLVGKNLMLHPSASVTGYFDDDLNAWLGPVGEPIRSLEFYETRDDVDFVRGAKMCALPVPGPLNALEMQRGRGFDEIWGPAFHDVIRSHASAVMWCAIADDLPDEKNRITLDESLTDSDGLPAPKVHYRVSENSRKILDFSIDRMQEIQDEMGCTHTVVDRLWIDQPGHLLGTAKMGDDPARSVVDASGRSHDVSNLYVADGSLFVTGGSVNPTSTISALALKVAKGLAENPPA
jgi:choline dehydrogenase-like flavoprotein